MSASNQGRLEWVGRNPRLLHDTAAQFDQIRPLEGLTIGASIHLEPKTVALLQTLKRGGAKVVATGNLNSTLHYRQLLLRC